MSNSTISALCDAMNEAAALSRDAIRVDSIVAWAAYWAAKGIVGRPAGGNGERSIVLTIPADEFDTTMRDLLAVADHLARVTGTDEGHRSTGPDDAMPDQRAVLDLWRGKKATRKARRNA